MGRYWDGQSSSMEIAERRGEYDKSFWAPLPQREEEPVEDEDDDADRP